MAFVDRVIFLAAAGGTADFIESAAVFGFQTMEAAGAVDGATYGYVAQSTDLSQWEVGEGVWNAEASILARTTVLFNSLTTTAKVNFTAPPQVLLTPLANELTSTSPGNPTATAGPSAIDGTAPTYMRSDASPAVQIANLGRPGLSQPDGATIGINGAGIVSVINQRQLAKSDLTFYVSSTGSDSNPGTEAEPFATLQHAIDVLSSTIDIGGFTMTINLGAGTFLGAGMKSTVGGGNLQIQGAGPGITIIQDGPNDGVFNFGEAFSIETPTDTTIGLDGVTFQLSADSSISEIITCVVPGANWFLGVFSGSGLGVDFNLNTAANCIYLNSPQSFAAGVDVTIVGNGQTISQAILLQQGAQFLNVSSWTVTGDLTITQGFLSAQNATYFDDGASFSGPSVTGPRLYLVGGAVAFSYGGPRNLGITYFPGSTFGAVDGSSSYDGGPFAQDISGLPTTSDLDAGMFGVFKDTTGGGVYVAYNDAGTIKKVALT